MTDKQFDVLMNSIIQIVKDSETKDGSMSIVGVNPKKKN